MHGNNKFTVCIQWPEILLARSSLELPDGYYVGGMIFQFVSGCEARLVLVVYNRYVNFRIINLETFNDIRLDLESFNERIIYNFGKDA